MGTANYQTQNNFDLWVFNEDKYFAKNKKYYLEEYDDYNNYSEEKLYEMIIDDYYTWFEEDFNDVGNILDYEFTERKNKSYRPLEFFEIDFESGYYTGVQLFVKPKDNRDYYDIYNWDNEDFQYEFGECKSVVLRRFIAEIKRINKHILPFYADRLYMMKLGVVGRFSNGEVVYERIGE